MHDDDRPERPPPEDDEDYPRARRSTYRERPRGPQAKSLSVIGLIALIIGVISLALGLIPCFGMLTLPLPILGIVLAVIGVIMSAVGQREGLGVPITGLALNAVACALPVAIVLGFCGMGMRSGQQMAQAMQAQMERQEVERREQQATRAAGAVGLCAGPQGPLAGVSMLDDGQQDRDPFAVLRQQVDLDVLVREYDLNPATATRKFQDRVVRTEGSVQWFGKDTNGQTSVTLQGVAPGNHQVMCVFDDPDVPEPDLTKMLRGQQLTVEGTCEGRLGVGQPVHLSGCKVIK